MPEGLPTIRSSTVRSGGAAWRARLQLALGCAITIFFGVMLARLIDVAAVKAVIVGVRLEGVALALALLATGYLVRICRWRRMLHALAVPATLAGCAQAFLIGNALNNVLPMRAGDAVRVFAFAQRLDSAPSVLLGTVLVERLLDVAMLLLIFFIVLPALPAGGIPEAILNGVRVIAVAIVGVVLGMLLLPHALRRALRHFFGEPEAGGAVLGFVHRLLVAIERLCRPGVMIPLLGLTVVGWLLEGGFFFVVIRALDLPLPLVAAYGSLALGTLATLIPSAPGYFGTFHYFVIQAVIGFGLSTDQAAAFALVTHTLLWLSVTSAGLIALPFARLSRRTDRSPSSASTFQER